MPASAIYHQWDFKLPVTGLCVNRDGVTLAVALGDGSLRLLAAHEDAEQAKELALHDGISLSLQPDADGHGFLSGGDDGKVLLIDPGAIAPTLIAEHKNKWVDHVAASSDGKFRAYSIGKLVYLLDESGAAVGTPLEHPSSVGGLSFSPNGKRLAASHYNGVSLWWTNAKDSAPVRLNWKGSHLGSIWSPDGKHVLTSMQDDALHGWRLSDTNEMRMQGYNAKVQSMAFTARGRFLATSGAPEVICWPFFGGGPWGKTPITLGSREQRLVAQVAAHPKDELVAAGFDDGMIIMSPLDGRMEMLILPPQGKDNGVIGLCWNGAGDCLFAALADGRLLLFTIESVRKATLRV